MEWKSSVAIVLLSLSLFHIFLRQSLDAQFIDEDVKYTVR
jgi:hypothetical protein